jgi:O-antigen ligase
MNLGPLVDPLLLVLFLVIDVALVVAAVRRPWLALVALLALLPFSGLITQVLPVLLDLASPGRLALAAWRDALVAGIAIAAAWSLLRARSRRLGVIEWLVVVVLALGAVYVLVSPVLVTALYVYRVLYEPPLVLASVLVLGRTRGAPSWLAERSTTLFLAGTTIAALFTWIQVYVLRFRFLQAFYTEPGERIHHSYLATGINQPRGIGTLNSPNEFGAVLAIALALLLTPGLLRMPGWLRSTLVVINALALLLTFSRSGMLSLVVALAVILVLRRGQLPSRARIAAVLRQPLRLWPIVAPVLVGLVMATLVFTTSGAQTLVEATASGVEPSAGGRTASVRAGVRVLVDHPLGLGLGTAGPKAARFAEELPGGRVLTEMWYLVYAIQVGVIGFLALAALAVAVLWQLWRTRASPLSATMIGVGVGLGVGAAFIPIIEDPAVFTPLWAFSGIAIVTARLAAEPVERDVSATGIPPLAELDAPSPSGQPT